MKLSKEEMKGIERNLSYIVDNCDGWVHLHIKIDGEFSCLSVTKSKAWFSRFATYCAEWDIGGGVDISITNPSEVFYWAMDIVNSYNDKEIEKQHKDRGDKIDKARKSLVTNQIDRTA